MSEETQESVWNFYRNSQYEAYEGPDISFVATMQTGEPFWRDGYAAARAEDARRIAELEQQTERQAHELIALEVEWNAAQARAERAEEALDYLRTDLESMANYDHAYDHSDPRDIIKHASVVCARCWAEGILAFLAQPHGQAAGRVTDTAPLLEKFAQIAHDSWAGWLDWMIEKWDKPHSVDGTFKSRWLRQAKTPYDHLTEAEKESDRAEARKYLAAVDALLAERGEGR